MAGNVTPRSADDDIAAIRYVALGDSYTIGTSATADQRWPDHLVRVLNSAARGGAARPIELIANLAVEGFTSADVIEVELPRLAALRPEFVTLLVGVNDVVRRVPSPAYRRNVERILEDIVSRVGRDRVLGVTTPDYTVTPAGSDYGDPARQSAAIREVNAILSDVARERGVTVVDIHDISLRAAGDPSLVAVDGLHPSGEQYRLWVERIAPAVTGMLSSEPEAATTAES